MIRPCRNYPDPHDPPRAIRGAYTFDQCRHCWHEVNETDWWLERNGRAKKCAPEPPPCAYRGDPLTGSERNQFGLSHVKDWRECSHPTIPLGKYVCPCDGCGSACRGYTAEIPLIQVQPAARSLILSDPVRPISNKPPKILLCSHNLDLTGAPTILLNLAKHLRGFDADIYSPHTGTLIESWRAAGFEPIIGELPDPKAYDLILANTLVSAPAVDAAVAAGVPVCWMIHEADPKICGQHWFHEMRRLIVKADKVVFPGPSTQAAYREWRPDSELIETIIPRMPRLSDRPDPESFTIVCIGTIEHRKGQSDLIAAAKGLPVTVVIIGQMSHADEVVGWDADSNKARFIILPPSADRFKWLALADLAVHCARLESNVPLAIQEAKAYGLPIICSKVENISSVVRDFGDGLHYTAGDVTDLRSKIEHLMNDRDELKRLSTTVRGDFDSYMNKLETVFRETAGRAPQRDLIRVVYHVAGMGDHWQQIVAEQLDQLMAAGIDRLFLTHCGVGLEWITAECERRGIDASVLFSSPDLTVYEQPAMRLIYALAHRSDMPILYLHSKGVSHLQTENVWHDWRRLMMRETVQAWRSHARKLGRGSLDAIGVNWWAEKTIENHFSGNFWMASAKWIRGLLEFDDYLKWYRRTQDTGPGGPRYACERWIGSVPGARIESLVCHDVRFHLNDNLYKAMK